MEVRFPGIGPKLLEDPAAALAKAEKKDVPLLYWTAASWGSAIGLGVDKPDSVIDLPTVRALADRALALDEIVGQGHAARDVHLARQPARGARRLDGTRARSTSSARWSSRRSRLPGRTSRSRSGVAVPAQDRAEFESLLKQALAVDPDKDPSTRLVTLVQQRRARALLDQIDTRFAQSHD